MTVKTEELVLNMGPQHPSTHGVLRLILHLEGEKILKVEPVIGYLHRGVEKLCEYRGYDNIPPILERNDYLAPSLNALAFVLAVEKGAGIEVPKRAQYLRVLLSEIERITSHLVAIGTYGLDLGGAFGGGTNLAMFCFRDREKLLDLKEILTGSRFHPNFVFIGGVRYDVPAGFDRKVKETVKYLRKSFEDYEPFLTNSIFKARTVNVGVLPKDLALRIGASGPTLRASGVPYDVRKAEGYSSYNDFQFNVITLEGGDAFSRATVRYLELFESLKIIEQVIDGLPSGPISSRMPVKTPVGIKLPPNTWVYAKVESPRGELGAFIYSDGKPQPARVKLRSPSYSNLMAIQHILPGHYIADTIAILGSLDPVFGDVDR